MAAAGTPQSRIAQQIISRANSQSQGKCAQFVREAIESALSTSLSRTNSAKDYGPSLVKAGFQVVSGAVQNGDVAIYDAIANHEHGHMQVFANGGWYSDFKQIDQYPGPAYRQAKASYTLYRYSS